MRNDVGIEEGSVVPIDYDPMLGKLIVSGRDRAEAIDRLARALDEYEIGGVETTLPLFRELVRDPDFRAGRIHTQWLDAWLANRKPAREEPSEEEVMLAAVCVTLDAGQMRAAPDAAGSRWKASARSDSLRSGRARRGHRR